MWYKPQGKSTGSNKLLKVCESHSSEQNEYEADELSLEKVLPGNTRMGLNRMYTSTEAQGSP